MKNLDASGSDTDFFNVCSQGTGEGGEDAGDDA